MYKMKMYPFLKKEKKKKKSTYIPLVWSLCM